MTLLLFNFYSFYMTVFSAVHPKNNNKDIHNSPKLTGDTTQMGTNTKPVSSFKKMGTALSDDSRKFFFYV